MSRPCGFEETTRKFFDALFPALKFKARSCGYALLQHGTLRTDIDLVAVPWRPLAIGQESLAEELRKVAEAIIGTADARSDTGTIKPNGRMAWSFYLVPPHSDGPYIDLSVFPPRKDKDD